MQTSQSSPQQAIQTLLEKTLDQNRLLFWEIARFARNESLRLATRNLEYADHAFAHFDRHRNLVGLIGAQQEWIREMMQEFAAPGRHYTLMFRNLAQGVQHQAEQAASEFGAQTEAAAEELGKTDEVMMHEVSRAAE